MTFIDNTRNLVSEILLSLTTPALIIIVFGIKQKPMTDFDLYALIFFCAAMFAFPAIRTLIWWVCGSIGLIVVFENIKYKCLTVWDCKTPYDLFNQRF